MPWEIKGVKQFNAITAVVSTVAARVFLEGHKKNK